MRDRLKNSDLFVGSQGGYHTGNAPGWQQLSSRDKLRRFGASRSTTDYGGMGRRGGR